MSGEGQQGHAVRRHFEGWQLGLLAVAMAVLSAWVAVPRPVEPTLLPLPLPDRRRLAEEREQDRALVESASRAGLPFEVRAVGELVRRHGLAGAHGDRRRATLAMRDARDEARRALAQHGPDPLRRLRAVQTDLFLREVESYVESGRESRELQELGGDFATRGAEVGWLGKDRSLALSPTDLWALFRLRWTELVGLRRERALTPSLDDYRAYYRVLLEHPEGKTPEERSTRQLDYVRALAGRDSAYPEHFARGVLLHRLGQRGRASDAFLRHLAEHPDGPWALRARNHALAIPRQAPADP